MPDQYGRPLDSDGPSGITQGQGSGISAVGGETFKTIDCPAGTDPVADSSTDTLTLIAGAGITITGDAVADSVTIAATGSESHVDFLSDGVPLKVNGTGELHSARLVFSPA